MDSEVNGCNFHSEVETVLITEIDENLLDYTLFNSYTRSSLTTLKLIIQSGYYYESSDSIYNMLLTIVLVSCGWIYCSYILILVSNIIIAGANSENKFEEMSTEIEAFCDAKKVSPRLRTRIQTHFKYKFQQHYFNEEAIRQSTPANLSKEILMHSCANLVTKAPLFKEVPQLLLENIVNCLKLEIFFANDVIIEAGSIGDSMYFIAFGTAAIYSASGEIFHFSLLNNNKFNAYLTHSGKLLGTVNDGAHFGEVSLLIKGQKRIANVVALEMCECYKLSQKDFRKVIEPHANILHQMKQIALERIKIVSIQEND